MTAMDYQLISLTFQDFEQLTFKNDAIHAFEYQLDGNAVYDFKLTLIKDTLLKNNNVTAEAFLKNQLSWPGLEEYLLADHPGVENIHFVDAQGLEKSFHVKWAMLPNPSLQDCQCEPINGNAYSKLEDGFLIVGADSAKTSTEDHYMLKEKKD